MVQSLFLTAALLLIRLPHSAAASRECKPVLALNGSTADLVSSKYEFSCGGSGDVLSVVSVLVASCDANRCVVAACESDKHVAFFSGPCDGEETCEVDVKMFAGCGLEVEMECEKGGLDPFTVLVLALIFNIIFAMGTTCTVEEFRAIWRTKKRAFAVGWISQFGFMPLFAYCMALAFEFDDVVAVGVVLCGAAPGGTTSNLFTYWSGGNVPLSIAMSLASTVCAVFMLPLLVEVYVMSTFTEGLDGASVAIPFGTLLIMVFVTIIIPVILGMTLRRYNTKTKIAGRLIYKWVEIIGSVLGGLFLAAAVVVGIKDNPDLMKPAVYPLEWVLAGLFQPTGCLFGLTVATLMKLDGRDRIAVALETGVQNYTLVIGIVALSYSGCTRVEALTFVLISSAWYVVSSAWIVSLLRVARKKGWWHLDVDASLSSPGSGDDDCDGSAGGATSTPVVELTGV